MVSAPVKINFITLRYTCVNDDGERTMTYVTREARKPDNVLRCGYAFLNYFFFFLLLVLGAESLALCSIAPTFTR